ncbi:MAG: HNH endonuclease, partial [Anaerolineae bacterium CG_4_9_14_0_8_um_filter_58_9]
MTSGQITVELRARLRVEANDRCGYCQTQQVLAYGSLEVDHIIPAALGGSDDIDNLWLACRPCNQYKAS